MKEVKLAYAKENQIYSIEPVKDSIRQYTLAGMHSRATFDFDSNECRDLETYSDDVGIVLGVRRFARLDLVFCADNRIKVMLDGRFVHTLTKSFMSK